MLLTNAIEASNAGGRALLCKLHQTVLDDLFGDHLILFSIPKSTGHNVFSVARAMSGHIDGLNTQTMDNALDIIQKNGVSRLFVDGSNFGGFVKVAKQRYPDLEIITFFHNVEAKFFLDALRQSRTPRALGVLAANYLAERKAVRYSDKLICMSKRDSILLHKLYGRAATHFSSMAMLDQLPHDEASLALAPVGQFALFVGGNFYANRSGIRWFVEHVVPRIGIKTVIVGRGLDDLRFQREINSKVAVVGSVDCLKNWYRDAQFVIAPIFSGSGMKTKVAEALMFGKKIVGTPEAFSGYEDVVGRAGWMCETADDFVAAIAEAHDTIVTSCDPQLRAIYTQQYSYAAARSRLAEILSVALT